MQTDFICIDTSKKRIFGELVVNLWKHINLRRRWQLFLLFLMMGLSSVAETISIGAVVPFLSALIEPNRLYNLEIIQPLIIWCNIRAPEELVLPLAIAFAIATTIATFTKTALLYLQMKTSNGIGIDLSLNIFRKSLCQDYATHTKRNSSELIAIISEKVGFIIYCFIMPILTLLSTLLTLGIVSIFLLYLAPLLTSVTLVFFISIYWIILQINRRHLTREGSHINKEKVNVIKILQESFGNIRDILLDSAQEAYIESYRRSVTSLRNSETAVGIRGGIPRHLVEALSIFILIVFSLALAKYSDSQATFIATLGAMALSAQRVLPLLSGCFVSLTNIHATQATVAEALILLNQPLQTKDWILSDAKMTFSESICLKNVHFNYEVNSPDVLKDVSLRILKGTRVGIIGATGCGKSTLLDILMGLLHAKSGSLEVDGCEVTIANARAWQKKIAHVPQTVFLADTSIIENITLGTPYREIDFPRAYKAAEMAQLSDFINTLPGKYDTQVGERGVRLSGGQRQRIGIARALYKGADVLILDEATSALDAETELSVMEAVDSLSSDLTLIIVAHRHTTLKACSEIFEIKEGCLQPPKQFCDLVTLSSS